MTEQEAWARYVAAHVRVHAVASVRDWSASDLLESFLLLPSPAVGFAEWKAMLGLKIEEPAVEANTANLAMLPSDVAKIEKVEKH